MRAAVCFVVVAVLGLLPQGASAVEGSTSHPVRQYPSCLPIVLDPNVSNRYPCTLENGGVHAGPGTDHGGSGTILDGPCQLTWIQQMRVCQGMPAKTAVERNVKSNCVARANAQGVLCEQNQGDGGQ